MQRQGPSADISFLSDTFLKGSDLADFKAPEETGSIHQEYWPSWVPDWTVNIDPFYKFSEWLPSDKGASDDLDTGSWAIIEQHRCQNLLARSTQCLKVRGFRIMTVDAIISKDQNAGQQYLDFTTQCVSPRMYPGSQLTQAEVFILLMYEKKHPEPEKFSSLSNKSYKYWKHIAKCDRYHRDLTEDNPESPTVNWYQSVERMSTAMVDKDETVRKALTQPRLPAGESFMDGRTMFLSRYGFIGIARENVQKGDVVAMFFGAKLPFVIREEGDHCLLIGECLVPSVINGEAMEDLKESKIENFIFC